MIDKDFVTFWGGFKTNVSNKDFASLFFQGSTTFCWTHVRELVLIKIVLGVGRICMLKDLCVCVFEQVHK